MNRAGRLRLVFDLDGTLLDSDGCDYERAESVREHTRPHTPACELVRAAYANGHGVAYLTGRCHHVRALTEIQLESARLPPGQLITQDVWRGYEAMTHYKAGALRALRADLYVGDHQADADAAALAGVPFLHADHWRAGTLPHHIAPIVHRENLLGFQRADTLQEGA